MREMRRMSEKSTVGPADAHAPLKAETPSTGGAVGAQAPASIDGTPTPASIDVVPGVVEALPPELDVPPNMRPLCAHAGASAAAAANASVPRKRNETDERMALA
jgi:hypothetical protein